MILYELSDRTAIIHISSGKGNMIGTEDIVTMEACLDQIIADPAVDGVILKGEERCFCTGLNPTDACEEKPDNLFFRFDKLLLRMFMLPKPIVTVVEGHSIGGGLLLQCCADYVIAVDSPRIKIGLPELKIGLTIDTLMTELLQYTLGSRHILQQLLYNGEYISPTQAKEINLINELTSRENLENVVHNAVTRLQGYNKNSFRVTKTTLRHTVAEYMQTALDNRCFEVFKELQ